MICIFLMTNIEHLFTCFIHQPYNSFRIICPFLLGSLFSIDEFWKFFIYSGDKTFIRYMLCTYFLPFCDLLLHHLSAFRRAEVFNFDEVQGVETSVYVSQLFSGSRSSLSLSIKVWVSPAGAEIPNARADHGGAELSRQRRPGSRAASQLCCCHSCAISHWTVLHWIKFPPSLHPRLGIPVRVELVPMTVGWHV